MLIIFIFILYYLFYYYIYNSYLFFNNILNPNLAAKDIGVVRRLELFDESNIIAVIPSNETNYGMLTFLHISILISNCVIS